MDSPSRREPELFTYELRMPAVSSLELEGRITDDDLLIVNPSLSHRCYGWRLPGFKICYVQGFSTFSLLDRRFDYYVAASDFVAAFLRTVYDIGARVIPPFIDLTDRPRVRPWSERPAAVIQPYVKKFPDIASLSLLRLREVLKERLPGIEVAEEINGQSCRIPHRDLLARIGCDRYFLSLSPAEGFGLVPLEAMAMSTVVFGYDGFGGRQFMVPGRNCAVAAFAEIECVAQLIIGVLESSDRGALMAARGACTASAFTYERFRAAWVAELRQILERFCR